MWSPVRRFDLSLNPSPSPFRDNKRDGLHCWYGVAPLWRGTLMPRDSPLHSAVTNATPLLTNQLIRHEAVNGEGLGVRSCSLIFHSTPLE